MASRCPRDATPTSLRVSWSNLTRTSPEMPCSGKECPKRGWFSNWITRKQQSFRRGAFKRTDDMVMVLSESNGWQPNSHSLRVPSYHVALVKCRHRSSFREWLEVLRVVQLAILLNFCFRMRSYVLGPLAQPQGSRPFLTSLRKKVSKFVWLHKVHWSMKGVKNTIMSCSKRAIIQYICAKNHRCLTLHGWLSVFSGIKVHEAIAWTLQHPWFSSRFKRFSAKINHYSPNPVPSRKLQKKLGAKITSRSRISLSSEIHGMHIFLSEARWGTRHSFWKLVIVWNPVKRG